jgi:hypothetical protein
MQAKGDASEAHGILEAQTGGVDLLAVEKRSIARAQITDVHATLVARDFGMPARDRWVENWNVARQRPSDHEEGAGAQLK